MRTHRHGRETCIDRLVPVTSIAEALDGLADGAICFPSAASLAPWGSRTCWSRSDRAGRQGSDDRRQSTPLAYAGSAWRGSCRSDGSASSSAAFPHRRLGDLRGNFTAPGCSSFGARALVWARLPKASGTAAPAFPQFSTPTARSPRRRQGPHRQPARVSTSAEGATSDRGLEGRSLGNPSTEARREQLQRRLATW